MVTLEDRLLRRCFLAGASQCPIALTTASTLVPSSRWTGRTLSSVPLACQTPLRPLSPARGLPCPVASFVGVAVKATGGFPRTAYVTAADAADQIHLQAARQLRAARACLAMHPWPTGERSSNTRFGRRGLAWPVTHSAAQHQVRGATARTDPVSPARSQFATPCRSVSQGHHRLRPIPGKSRTIARAHSEGLSRSSNNSRRARQVGRRPARKPFYRADARQVAARRRLLAVHARATMSPKPVWGLPRRGLCRRNPQSDISTPGFLQVRPPRQQVQPDN